MINLNWPWRRKDPTPVPQPQVPDDESATLGLPKYLQAWRLLRKIPIKNLFPAAASVSTVVFLAISGLVAWLVLFSAFAVKLLRIVL